MSDTVGAVDPNLVVEKALDTARTQTGASVCGFLNLDTDHLLSRMVVPERAGVDTVLSKQLTQRIAQTGDTVWQHGGQDLSPSDSLAAYTDAVGIPVRGDEDESSGHCTYTRTIGISVHARCASASERPCLPLPTWPACACCGSWRPRTHVCGSRRAPRMSLWARVPPWRSCAGS